MKPQKFRIPHRNVLFPLVMRNENDEKQQNMEEKEPKLTGMKEENGTLPGEHVGNYEGPITRSKPKKDGKCIVTQGQYFNVQSF